MAGFRSNHNHSGVRSTILSDLIKGGMKFNRNLILIIFTCILLNTIISGQVSAHRPLTTQTAYPVDVHKIKLERGIKYVNFPADDEAYSLDVELNYGVINNLDIGVEVPYVFWRPEAGEKVDTIGDMILKSRLLFLKGREGNPLSLTIQPFYKVPSTENDKSVLRSGPGLSTGETDFGFLFIGTREMDYITAHMNLGYVFINRPSFGSDYQNVFSFKLAMEYKALNNIELVGELTGEKNKNAHDDDIFSILLGTRFPLTDDILIDAGFNVGLSDSSPDYVATMGLTMGF